LLSAVPPGATADDYEAASVTENVLGKATDAARRRTFRYLRELYLLRPTSILFRSLRDLWDDAPARPVLAGLCALARDPVFRASAAAITSTTPGDTVTSSDLSRAVGSVYPGTYRDSTLAKIGRNTLSSWEQTGHLSPGESTGKVRVRATARPASTAYALLLGHLQGITGAALFETEWARVLDQPRSHLTDLAVLASQGGLIDFRHAGGVIEVGFSALQRPFEGELF
jgi:hypothetical protein